MSERGFGELFHCDDRATMAKKPRDRMEALLSVPDTASAVQALSDMEFYELYHAVGPGDAGALVEYGSAEQVQTCLDLDIWRGDQMSDAALMPWVEQLLSVPDDQFRELWNHLDPEVMALYLHRNIHLYVSEDRNDEVEIPDEASKNVAQTPDFLYWVAYPEDDDKAEQLRQLVDRLYAVFGVEKAWSILEGMHWEMSTDLEENAYHFRTERIRELGFMPRDEAASLFATLDVAREVESIRGATQADLYVGHLDSSMRLEMALASLDESAAAGCYLGRILSRIGDLETVKVQLLALAQQIAVFDGYQPHEREGFDDSMVLAVSYSSLGLEYASRHDDEVAERIVRHVPLRRLVTLGWNITHDLHHKAKLLVCRGHLSIIEDQPLSLLTPELRDRIEGLLCARPRPQSSVLSPFVSVRDIQTSAAAIADVATRELFFGEALHKTKDDIARLAYTHELVLGVENVYFDNVAITFLARRAMKCAEPWSVFDVQAPPSRGEVWSALSDENIRSLFRSNMPESTYAALDRFGRQLRDYLETQWPASAETPDPRLVGAILFAESEP